MKTGKLQSQVETTDIVDPKDLITLEYLELHGGGGGTGGRSYKEEFSIAGGSQTIVNVNHGLSFTDVVVQVFRIVSPSDIRLMMPTIISIYDANTVDLTFTDATEPGDFRVVVYANDGSSVDASACEKYNIYDIGEVTAGYQPDYLNGDYHHGWISGDVQLGEPLSMEIGNQITLEISQTVGAYVVRAPFGDILINGDNGSVHLVTIIRSPSEYLYTEGAKMLPEIAV